MRRTIATLGIVGLGLMTATVSANAAPPENDKKITICHATSADGNAFVSEPVSLNALVTHANDTLDIVPPNEGDIFPEGQNWTTANMAFLANGCATVVVDPVDETPDPVDETPDPVVETPDPVAETPVEETPEAEEEPESAAPAAAGPASASAVVAPKAAAAAAVAKKTNVGYNVQTAVGRTSDTGIPVWLMALTGALTAGAAVVLRQGVRRARSTEN